MSSAPLPRTVQEFLDTAGGHALPLATTSAIRALVAVSRIMCNGLGNAIWLLLAQHAHFQEMRLVAGKSEGACTSMVRASVLLTHPDAGGPPTPTITQRLCSFSCVRLKSGALVSTTPSSRMRVHGVR